MFFKNKIGMDKTIIFVHIPRTGGTSLVKALKSHFNKDEVFSISKISTMLHGEKWAEIPYLERQANIEAYFRDLSAKKRKSYKLIIGHMNYGWHQYLDNHSYITFLRNPIDRVLSLYRYIMTYRIELTQSDSFSLTDFINSGHEEISNGIAKRLTGNHKNETQAGQALNNALEIIDSFDFVGLTENMKDSYNMLTSRFLLKSDELKRKNSTESDQFSFSDEELKRVQQLNTIDTELYQKCLSKYEEEYKIYTIKPKGGLFSWFRK